MRRFESIMVVALLLAAAGLGPVAAQEATPRSGPDEERVVELPDAWIAGPSPDGKSLVAAAGTDRSDRLCVYDVETLTEQVCGDLAPHQIALAVESIVWSPDSTRIAFAEHALRMLVDGDIWLMDVETGEISNLTDDGFEGPLPLFDPPEGEDADTLIHVDVLPAWAPDGRSLAFSRSTIVGGETRGNEIARLDLETGEIERIVVVSLEAPGVVTFGLAWSPNGQRLYYSLTQPNLDDPKNGVWVYDEADGLAKHLLDNDPEKGPPVLLRVAATGQTGLINYPLLMTQRAGEGEYYALLDLERNRVSPVNSVPRRDDLPDVVRAATFSPDGTSILYSLWRWEDGNNDLLLRKLSGGQATLVAGGIEGQVLPTTLGGGFVWTEDGTVFISTGFESAVLLEVEPD